MRLMNLTTRPATPDTTLARLSHQPFPTSDQVLLCGFRDDPAGERTVRELRDSLLAAGFPARVTRHLIRISPVLISSSKGRYQLKPFDCCSPDGPRRSGSSPESAALTPKSLPGRVGGGTGAG
jgi:hypothetical protein